MRSTDPKWTLGDGSRWLAECTSSTPLLKLASFSERESEHPQKLSDTIGRLRVTRKIGMLWAVYFFSRTSTLPIALEICADLSPLQIASAPMIARRLGFITEDGDQFLRMRNVVKNFKRGFKREFGKSQWWGCLQR